MGNEAMAGNISHGFGSLGYAGGRTGFAAQYGQENHAFGSTEQAAPAATNNEGPLKAINSKVFGRGSYNIPFFGSISMGQGIVGLIILGAAYHMYQGK